MLGRVELRTISREDVARIVSWLDDSEISESWFGRYTYGDPAHLGYDPKRMQNASDEEWDRVFDDPNHTPRREVFSVYTLSGEHIGEAQLAIDESLGDAQLSVLIGRKDLWHHGYGTGAALAALEYAFDNLGLHRVWVDVPEYNEAARGMFEHIGFQHEGTLRQSRPHEGARFNSVILGMLAEEFHLIFPDGVKSHVATWDSPRV